MTYYKVLKDLRSCHGGDAVWTPGRWMPLVKNIKPCKSGYHLCDGEGQLLMCIGKDVWVAEAKGEIIHTNDEIVASQARIVEKTKWNARAAVAFMRDCVNHAKPVYSYYVDKVCAITRGAAALADAHLPSIASDAAWAADEAARLVAKSHSLTVDNSYPSYMDAYRAEKKWQIQRLRQYLDESYDF